MQKVLPSSRDSWRIVVLDRYYTSVILTLKLTKLKMHCLGTIQTSRIGSAEFANEEARQIAVFGLVDLALVGDFIVYRELMKSTGKSAMRRYELTEKLRIQPAEVTSGMLEGIQMRACKIYSLMKKPNEPRDFNAERCCANRSEDTKRMHLCQVVQRQYEGNR
ncbi:hypothetical protein FI667_g529, partial [Globisporangium splendens]